MSRLPRRLAVAGLLAALAGLPPSFGVSEALGQGAVSGVCPDGSAFIVQRRADIPCSKAKVVEPSDLPPMRPEMLPRPYGWDLEHRARNPQNPYNLIEAGKKLREAAERNEPTAGAAPAPARAPQTAPQPLALDRGELEDLVRVVSLRQEVAPASFRVADAADREVLWIRLAHSAAFEQLALDNAGLDQSQERVLVFLARAVSTADFHPNFLISQSGITHRPDPTDLAELEFLVGEPGSLDAGTLALGYFRMPARFDPSRPLDLWWNDRSIRVTLSPR